MIAVLDYGIGNVKALLNMYEYLGIEAIATQDAGVLSAASGIILPGVGAFDAAMARLIGANVIPALERAVFDLRVPFLGICLGMQILGRRSDEGNCRGLGWINATVKRLDVGPNSNLKVPHIGWEQVRPTRPSMLFPDINVSNRFYFVHSYHMVCDAHADVIATVDYGGELCCAIGKENIIGVQFHPEKSHRYGMQLLKTFASMG